MARLTRKNIKVFAENATDNGVFGSLQANNPTTTSDVEQIQSLSAWSDGWNSATETSEMLPPLEEFQGVQYVTTYQQAYLMQEGIPEWAATVTYFKGSLTKKVTSTGFQIYNSLTDNNTGNLLSDTSNWKKVMDSDDLYAFDNSVVHKAGAETITGTKTFSVSPIVPTAASGDSSTKAANTAFVTTADSNLQTQINTKANSSDVVNLTGTQTITGTKTFSGWGGFTTYIKHNDVTYNTAPSSDKSVAIAFTDKNGVAMGVVESWRYPDNATCTQLNAYGANGAWVSQSLGLIAEANGNAWAYAPNSDYYDSIVTTRGIGKWDNGYVRLGNGITLQWGRYDNGVNSAGFKGTITLPTPFASTAYSFSLVGTRANDEDIVAAINCEGRWKSTTAIGFQCSRTSGSSAGIRYIDWVAIGY